MAEDFMMDEELDNTIELMDEDGNAVSFEFLDLVEYEGNNYVVLLPQDDDDDGMVVILQVEDAGDDENENYIAVEDEDVLNAVFTIFKEKFKDEFDFAE
jgi:uncharacterized protein YrzB (UPF0473 family)